MVRKTQEEINYWFQDNTVKSALDLSLIEKKIHNNGLDIPNNIIIHKNGSTYEDFAHWYYNEIKISKYPTSYKECWQIIFEVDGETTLEEFHHISGYYSEPLGALQKLLCCRDAYWKIAGEELGLDGHWEPETPSRQYVSVIENVEGKIQKNEILCMMLNRILSFPTEEMRDAFYDNFKDLIESCKTLL